MWEAFVDFIWNDLIHYHYKGPFILALRYVAVPIYQLLSAATQRNSQHSK